MGACGPRGDADWCRAKPLVQGNGAAIARVGAVARDRGEPPMFVGRQEQRSLPVWAC